MSRLLDRQQQVEDELRRLKEEEASVWHRYTKCFRENGPPMMAWSGSQEGIEALMEAAIARGRMLEPDDLSNPPDDPNAVW